MKRLRLLDAALLIVVSLLWSVCFGLYLREVIQGRLARVPLFLASPEQAESYPTIIGFWPGSSPTTADLQAGDQLTSVGEVDLRGVGPVRFLARAYEQARGKLEVSVSFIRDGQPGDAILHLAPFTAPWGIALLIVGFAITGVLVLLRMPRSRPARAFFLASLAYSIHWCFFFGGPRWQTYAWIAVYTLSSLCIFPLILKFTLLLPEEVAPTGRWMFLWPWLFMLRGPTAFSWYFGWPLPHEIGMRATNLLEVAFVVTLLALLTYNFRRAGPLGRRQLKWVVYGLYVSTAPVLAAAAIAILDPRLWWLQEASMSVVVLLPICICIAIVRFNLFDIDRLISSTATYSLLFLLLGAGLLSIMPNLSASLSAAIGIRQTVGQVFLSLFLALVIFPGHRLLRPQIERLFFVERYRIEKGVKLLLEELPTCGTPRTLLMLVGERIIALLQPESCVIYGQVGEIYVPVFVRGSVVPPAFQTQSPLIGVLQTRTAPVDIERWRRTARTSLSPDDRAILDSLRVMMVLPLSQSEPPLAFFCLGQKRSGDVYPPADFALLMQVAKKVAEQLLHWEGAEVHRQIEIMQHTLRSLRSEQMAFPTEY